jgi:hypothetical protein
LEVFSAPLRRDHDHFQLIADVCRIGACEERREKAGTVENACGSTPEPPLAV